VFHLSTNCNCNYTNFLVFYRQSRSSDFVKFLQYLTNASYENFHQLELDLPEDLPSPEQYMEIIINVSITLYRYLIQLHIFAHFTHNSKSEYLI
jgi:hypothetical protein